MGTPDPLAAALLACTPKKVGAPAKMERAYSPEVLDAIRVLRRDRGMSYDSIAENVGRITGVSVCGTTVGKWLRSQGIE